MEKEVRNLATVEERTYNIRLHMHLTQREFANILGISASYVSNWENGYNEVTVVLLNKICNMANVSFDYMMGLSNSINDNIIKVEYIDKKYLGAKIREIRKANKCTQEKLANKINTHRFLISDYETGRKAISVADLKQICETFGYSADYCVGKLKTCIKYEPVNKIKTKEIKELVNV